MIRTLTGRHVGAPSLKHADHFIDDCFRHEYGRIVAGLARRYGMGRLDLIEDVVQDAMMAALDTWRRACCPPRRRELGTKWRRARVNGDGTLTSVGTRLPTPQRRTPAARSPA